jgi:hypothetical protein
MRCTAAASRAALRTRCAAGGNSETGAEAEVGDGGQDKRVGTYPAAKPVCTWVGHGTATCSLRAAKERHRTQRQARPRAVLDAVRCHTLEHVPWPRVTVIVSKSGPEHPGAGPVRATAVRRNASSRRCWRRFQRQEHRPRAQIAHGRHRLSVVAASQRSELDTHWQ